MAVHALDNYYLAITFLITVAYQLIGFSIAFAMKFDKLTDFMGGTNFAWLAIITLSFSASQPDHVPTARQIVISLFTIVWSLRLSGFLLFRILKTGKDDRFDDKRDKFFPFLGFWVFQMLWVWTVSLPVTILNSPSVQRYRQPAFGTGGDIAGVILWTIGFFFEVVSDAQKYRFKVAHSGDKGAVTDIGLFKLSRHPNYFGEVLMQFSVYMIAVSPAAIGYVRGGANRALYASILGPIFLTALLFGLSGLPLQERPGAKKRYESGNNWEGYKKWLDSTSIFWPVPQAVWSRLPTIVKRTVGLEFPPYVFDPAKHADSKQVDDRQSEEGLRGNAEGEQSQS